MSAFVLSFESLTLFFCLHVLWCCTYITEQENKAFHISVRSLPDASPRAGAVAAAITWVAALVSNAGRIMSAYIGFPSPSNISQ
ncbi:hypothetical protein BCR43DRAFT_488404 [Syncephalastrum racemosum]|uniref:Uncharacterized protein n=1 Tax=Syncephalastrum racemosum TaxID=13706 RepID=A0A1X2HIQ3_SYNRA|nr:hypothetical protein BCR43DRAFT_488404 [Syncephalastrum racemosum]